MINLYPDFNILSVEISIYLIYKVRLEKASITVCYNFVY